MDTPERKYRHIAENSNDLIFLLNDKAVITSMNAASRKALGYSPDEMTGESLYNFISDGPETNIELQRDKAREIFQKVIASEKPVKFRVLLRIKHIIAGLEMDVSLQKNVVDGKTEILGKSTTIFPEASELFLQRERGTYLISSNIAEGEIITRGLMSRLGKYFAPSEIKKLQLGFSEILLNAIEHGNLGISFAQKSAAIMSGDYLVFLLKRQKDPLYAANRVRIDFIFDAKRIWIRIRDDGAGFDHASYMNKVATDDSMLELEHGRGILMTKNIFDRVQYNEKGNQILLVKNRSPQPPTHP